MALRGVATRPEEALCLTCMRPGALILLRDGRAASKIGAVPPYSKNIIFSSHNVIADNNAYERIARSRAYHIPGSQAATAKSEKRRRKKLDFTS